MNVDISRLQNNIDKIIYFDEEIDFPKENLKSTEILDLSTIKAKGFIEKIIDNVYHISFNIKGNMILQCAISLDKVNYPLNITIDKNIEENSENIEENYEINGNILDIIRIVWENIVLEVPLRVVKENATCKTEGAGWVLLDEDDNIKSENPFNELKTMLDMEENK